MPAPEVTVHPNYPRNIVKHVNLMVDTYLANATAEDLRCAVRGLLASGTSGIASAFSSAARKHLCESGALIAPNPQSLFNVGDGEITPTQTLKEVIARARTVYGIGMGFASLEILIPVVEATIGAKWKRDGPTDVILTEVDADIVQAIQSCKEELQFGRVEDRGAAKQTVNELRRVVEDSCQDGVIVFEKAADSIRYWKF
ncbi:hypothetical protein EV361DRAFT_330924 [Lentinula raphanica]|uniref:Uncharacterized protein n=1 Tax=Lentinula raphanica TaxID=153919 RepID=A0AA38P5Y0_9AGAR|nr:hypothetical protein C8R42DRAFT_665454 [Lentinula raphanica]KAJ3756774.1 hypothetical protein EV360DRAFT_84637 [Lentinula raphanica]KAJ3778417.1 hypothetical protein FB446DRAFT_499612 [Lentinula raphanica]KAJ3828566.1 hypothetical protein F5880DRAFT_1529683 [Lentinula raphanica]KAJ3836889.1 hypothetical protein F5878DRAFT_624011 [Lentinula raphanica]